MAKISLLYLPYGLLKKLFKVKQVDKSLILGIKSQKLITDLYGTLFNNISLEMT